MTFNEKTFSKTIEPHIRRGRAGDWEHCKRVVKWVKILGAGREDLPLLIVDAYFYDIG